MQIAQPELSAIFTATGVSASALVFGPFVVMVWGTPLGGEGVPATFSGSVRVERSLDDGTTWLPVSTDASGTPADAQGARGQR